MPGGSRPRVDGPSPAARGCAIRALQGAPSRRPRPIVAPRGDGVEKGLAGPVARPPPALGSRRFQRRVHIGFRDRLLVGGIRTRDSQVQHLVLYPSELPRSGPAPVPTPFTGHAPPTARRRGGRAAGPTGPAACLEETPVGIEPTCAGLQPAAWPSGSSVDLVSRRPAMSCSSSRKAEKSVPALGRPRARCQNRDVALTGRRAPANAAQSGNPHVHPDRR